MQSTDIVRASEISFNEGVIRLASVHDKSVTFRYAKSQSSPVEQRTLVPQNVKHTEGALLFVGECPDRGEGAMRSFRSDRIIGEVSFA